jgi:hypothetical protein
MALATEESTKCKAAKEVIKSLTSQVGFLLNFRHFHWNKMDILMKPCIKYEIYVHICFIGNNIFRTHFLRNNYHSSSCCLEFKI